MGFSGDRQASERQQASKRVINEKYAGYPRKYIGGKLITYICFTVLLVFSAQVVSTVIP